MHFFNKRTAADYDSHGVPFSIVFVVVTVFGIALLCYPFFHFSLLSFALLIPLHYIEKHRRTIICGALVAFLLPIQLMSQGTVVVSEILGRPTATSVTMSALFDVQVQAYFKWGKSSGIYNDSTAMQTAVGGTPLMSVFSNLQPDRRYYYRSCYRKPGDSQFMFGSEHTFHTQRKTGSPFRFTIEADAHPYDKKGNHSLLSIALKNQLADSADFLLDLGDTFGDDHNPLTITSEELRQLHLDWRYYFGLVCHSSPLFLCIGNHEGESGYYLLQTPPNNVAVNGTLWRKFYFPNPEPDGFYSGNPTMEGYGMGLPENYYAWEWGDALFVVLDAYRGYTANAKPRGWEWTFGKDQYDWFKRTLENSKATFKFVFTHHTLGETRGGTATAKLYEWGGYEADERTWGFTANRPGWSLPIHQLMVKNGVTIFFQGHDHLYAKEELDGIVYQEVPMPSDSTYIIGTRDNADAYTGVKLDASGHLRVTVSPSGATVDYVRAWLPADETTEHKNGEVAYSYSVAAKTTSVESNIKIPSTLLLEQNYPNPFNPSTMIRYQLKESGFVSLHVFDVLGREVVALVDEQQASGVHDVVLNAANLPGGVYYYQMKTQGAVETKKAILLK
ncbi:MAG: metallophosphoesterase [Ignavibacteriales bacterium]|nr:metallophosphoesterase [Ignavibacteriales bacterium]